jgi:hypothetical protein
MALSSCACATDIETKFSDRLQVDCVEKLFFQVRPKNQPEATTLRIAINIRY